MAMLARRWSTVALRISRCDSWAFEAGAATCCKIDTIHGWANDNGGSGADGKRYGLFLSSAGAIFGAVACWAASSNQQLSGTAYADAEKVALDPNEWRSFKLLETETITHNTKLLRFGIDKDAVIGLPVASCIVTRASIGKKKDGKPNYVIRPYTPISDPETHGYFDLMIKVYPEGKMSTHIGSLQPGDTLEVKGPISKLPYAPNMLKRIGMVAGGTGITPMLQIINEVLKNPDDKTQISLIYANVSPDDILLKQKLDSLAESHPNFKVYYVVDKPDKRWNGGVGYITKDMILKGLPEPSDDSMILVCGPPGMMNHISGDKAPDRSQGEVSGLLKELGYKKEHVFKF